VLVWLCIGGFVVGSNSWPIVDGRRFARDGVVTVVVNARLGAEAFVLLDDAPANRGVLDWLLALEWVQSSIGAFGGDPGNVTVAGHSAGGAATFSLVTCARARGLLRRAIVMSGPPFEGGERAARRRSTAYLQRLGVGATRMEVAAIGRNRLLSAQTRMFAELTTHADPLEAIAAIVQEGPPFRPVVDGELLSGEPLDLARAGAGSEIDVLVGSTAGEFDCMLTSSSRPVGREAVTRGLELLGLRTAADLGLYVRAHAELTPAILLGHAVSDALFRVWPTHLADVRVNAGGEGRTYLYEFAWPSPAFRATSAHGVEVPFAWDTLEEYGAEALTGSQPPQELADAMHRAWVRFVTDGTPGWPACEGESRPTMIFDHQPALRTDHLALERYLWDTGGVCGSAPSEPGPPR
jgi:para-nitrobenzyl esterase